MTEVKRKKKEHSCQLSREYEWLGKKYRQNCVGEIKGKVLKVELTDDKFDKSDELCMKIRINKWGEWGEGREENKPHLVYYGLENPWGKNKPSKEGKIYWFFLHERKGIDHKDNQRGWQWTHDWQLIKDEEKII